MQAMNPGTPARRAAAWLLLQRRGSLLGSARSFFQSAASASYEQGSSSSSFSSSSSSTFARHHDSSYGYGVPSDSCGAAAGRKHDSTTTSFFNFTTGSMRQSCYLRPAHMTVNTYAITSSCSQAVRLMSSSPAVAKMVEEPSSSSGSSSQDHVERSHYWGLVPRKTDQTKKDGTPWPWHCFKVSPQTANLFSDLNSSILCSRSLVQDS